MNFSALTSNDRLAVIAAIVVVITGVISLASRWGILVAVSALAAAAVVFIVLQPQIAPTVKLPMSKGTLMLGLSATSVVILVVVALTWLEYILTPPIFVFDTIQYFVGMIAAAVMTWAGWQTFQAEKGTAAATPPPAAPPPAAPPPAPPAV